MNQNGERHFAEAVRRILEARDNQAIDLDLAKLWALQELPQELSELTALQSLDLSECKGVSDLTPLAGLTGLQSLNLWSCSSVSDLTPLAGLTGLPPSPAHRYAEGQTVGSS
jgi:Leucine-rich repeat (LRR) protein